jgi:hypothetical protein
LRALLLFNIRLGAEPAFAADQVQRGSVPPFFSVFSQNLFVLVLFPDTGLELVGFWFGWLFVHDMQTEDQQTNIIRECFQLVSKRADNVCNFLEGGE